MNKFKVGDTVRLISKTSTIHDSINPDWVRDFVIGETYTIQEIIPTSTLSVRVNRYYLAEDMFELANSIEEVNLIKIRDKDPEFYNQIFDLIKYLASTYDDKYEASEPNAFHPRELLTSDVCMFNVSKYLKRYSTVGYDKSNNPKDVMKAIHYLLMSLNNK
jgi:hypothetical protein